MRRVSVLVALVAAAFVAAWLVFGAGRSVAAQDATPVAAAFPLTPDPAECQVARRPVEEFVTVITQATPVAVPPGAATVDVPVGELADEETVAAITATVREIIACFNAADFGRAFSLLTDEALRGFAAEEPIPEEELRGFLGATPEAVPTEGWTTILAITDVVVLADGRVGALVASLDPTQPEEGPTTIHLTFVQVDGRWLVDRVVEFHTHPEEEGAATPAP